MTSVEMRFFWLLLSTMTCSGEPFTHIYEWKRCSPSSGYSGSFFWILVVAKVALGSASMICFPLSFPLSGFDSVSEHASDLEAFISAISDCLADTHLCCEWNPNGTHTIFQCPSLSLWCSSSIAALAGWPSYPALALSFVPWFWGAFSLLRINRSKVSLLLFKLLLNLDSVSIEENVTRFSFHCNYDFCKTRK